jgi:hypothetical protein
MAGVICLCSDRPQVKAWVGLVEVVGCSVHQVQCGDDLLEVGADEGLNGCLAGESDAQGEGGVEPGKSASEFAIALERGAVIERAKELVTYARTQGYKPDELIQIIQQLG